MLKTENRSWLHIALVAIFFMVFHIGSALAAPIFVDNGDGTVSDNATGLVWQQSDAQNSGRLSWQGSINYCAGLVLGGRSDWRLPTFDELKSIAFSYDSNPKIDTNFFPGCLSELYWSSIDYREDTYPYDEAKAWGAEFYYGGSYYGAKSTPGCVRCVRNQADTTPMTFTPSTLDFGAPAPGESVDRTVTITNNTGYVLRDMQLTFNGPADASLFTVLSPDFTDNANKYLYPGLSVDVTIRYRATKKGLVREQADFDYMYNNTDGGTSILDVRAGAREETTVTYGTKKRQQTSDDPVALATGELLYGPVEVINLGGPLPLTVSVRYAGRLARENLSGDADTFLGHNWLHNYQIRIESAGTDAAEIAFRWGERLSFAKQEGQWVLSGSPAVPFQLRQDGGGLFHLLDPRDERIYGFLTDGRLKRIRDRNGNQITIIYVDELQGGDIRSIKTITDGLGRSLTSGPFRINANRLAIPYRTDGYLTSIKDMLGNTTQYHYTSEIGDSGYQLASVTHPLGNTPWTNAFDSQGRVVGQTDAYGNAWTFAYDTPSEGVTKITDPEGRESFSRHGSGAVWTGVADQAGKGFTLVSDDAGRPTELTDRLGDKTSFTYHAPSGRPASKTDAKGQSTTWNYESQEQTFINPDNDQTFTFTFYNLSRINYADGTRHAFTYDAKGNVLTSTDRAGHAWTYTYNDRGQELTATNPLGGTTTNTYNADATQASRTDSDTGTTTYGYDTYKRLNLVTYPDASTVRMVYDKKDRLTSMTDELNRTTTFTWDANGNLIKLTDSEGGEVLFEYDLMDRLVKTTNRLGAASTRTYDRLSRLAGMADATGVKVAYQYNSRGWLNQVTRAGKSWTMTYDDEGVPVTRTTPLSRTTTEVTDKLGLVVSVTDPMNGTTGYGRDAMNRVTSVTAPDNRVTTYAYNALGLLTGVALPGGMDVAYSYDDMGNLTQIRDLNGNSWDFDHTTMGRLKKQTDPLSRTVQYGHDSRGQLNAVAYPDEGTQNITYDAAGNVLRRQYSGGPDLVYSYDARNRLLTANDLSMTRDAEGRIIATVDGDALFGATYDEADRLKTVTYNNLFTVTYTYDVGENGTGLLTRVSDNLTNTEITFSYDDDHRLIVTGLPGGKTMTRTWDNADRLTRLRSGDHIDLSLTYDAGGRITAMDMTAPLTLESHMPTMKRTLTYDAASQTSAAGYSHDARGRTTAAPGLTFGWDGASRLTAAGDTSLTYNGLGKLRTRTSGGTTTHFYANRAIGLSPLVAEKNGTTGQFSRYYVWTPEGRLLYMIDAADGNKVYLYHFDQAGNTLALTDAGGTVTDAYAYDPYGRLLARTGSTTQPFTFSGAWGARQEGESGTLYQMGARYYDAATGRFLTPEPLWPQVDEPRAVNPYQYALADPLCRVDPTGLDDVPAERPLNHGEHMAYLREEIEKIKVQEKEEKAKREEERRQEEARLKKEWQDKREQDMKALAAKLNNQLMGLVLREHAHLRPAELEKQIRDNEKFLPGAWDQFLKGLAIRDKTLADLEAKREAGKKIEPQEVQDFKLLNIGLGMLLGNIETALEELDQARGELAEIRGQ